MDTPRHSAVPPEASGRERIARILLVDDVRRLVDLMRNYLKRTTCRVLTARNGAEAIRVCRKQRPDLVFLDSSIPGIDGLETCRSLKSDPVLRSIPIVIVTLRERTQECLTAGCDDVLTKPVVQDDFLAKVRRFVALRERTEPRIPVSLRVEVRAPAIVYIAYTKDLSLHGLFLKSPRLFAPGTRLKMTLHLPRGRPPLSLDGEVRRVVEHSPGGHFLPGIGVRLVEVAPPVERALQEFIQERLGVRAAGD